MNARWNEQQVRGKLDIYYAQIRRSSPGSRQETLQGLAGDLITQYAPMYPSIVQYRNGLR